MAGPGDHAWTGPAVAMHRTLPVGEDLNVPVPGGHSRPVRSTAPVAAQHRSIRFGQRNGAVIAPLLPDPGCVQGHGGRWEKHCRRQIVDAIFYVTDNGIKWRALPVDFTGCLLLQRRRSARPPRRRLALADQRPRLGPGGGVQDQVRRRRCGSGHPRDLRAYRQAAQRRRESSTARLACTTATRSWNPPRADHRGGCAGVKAGSCRWVGQAPMTGGAVTRSSLNRLLSLR